MAVSQAWKEDSFLVAQAMPVLLASSVWSAAAEALS